MGIPLFLLPLSIRRARQAGWLKDAYFLLFFITCSLITNICLELYADEPRLLSTLLNAWSTCLTLYFTLLLPLCIYGGTFAGEKTALMRAAINGDKARVRQEVEQNPMVIHLKNAQGHTAREYAEKAGQAAIADYLKEQEELYPAPQPPRLPTPAVRD